MEENCSTGPASAAASSSSSGAAVPSSRTWVTVTETVTVIAGPPSACPNGERKDPYQHQNRHSGPKQLQRAAAEDLARLSRTRAGAGPNQAIRHYARDNRQDDSADEPIGEEQVANRLGFRERWIEHWNVLHFSPRTRSCLDSFTF